MRARVARLSSQLRPGRMTTSMASVLDTCRPLAHDKRCATYRCRYRIFYPTVSTFDPNRILTCVYLRREDHPRP
jgi:hypothetical protein